MTAEAAEAPDLVSQQVGSYRVLRRLGQGGMSTVYEAIHEHIGRRAAIKVLLPALQEHPEVVARLFQEARATNQIHHPGIVAIYEIGHLPDGRAYLVMELLGGETLHARLARRGGRMAEGEAVQVARQVASILSAAHGYGIIHRDLKSENVMIVPDPDMPSGERVKLLDFGIAKVPLSDDQQVNLRTQTGALMGTPHYMSPEQCRGAGKVDGRTDVYSLGVMLFEMVSGRMPFLAAGLGEMLALQIYAAPPPLADVAPQASPGLCALVAQLLVKSPTERPTAAETVAALDRVIAAGAAWRASGAVAAVPAGTDETAPGSVPPGSVPPASALPAPGSVPPGSALPAGALPRVMPGSVPPGSALPAPGSVPPPAAVARSVPPANALPAPGSVPPPAAVARSVPPVIQLPGVAPGSVPPVIALPGAQGAWSPGAAAPAAADPSLPPGAGAHVALPRAALPSHLAAGSSLPPRLATEPGVARARLRTLGMALLGCTVTVGLALGVLALLNRDAGPPGPPKAERTEVSGAMPAPPAPAQATVAALGGAAPPDEAADPSRGKAPRRPRNERTARTESAEAREAAPARAGLAPTDGHPGGEHQATAEGRRIPTAGARPVPAPRPAPAEPLIPLRADGLTGRLYAVARAAVPTGRPIGQLLSGHGEEGEEHEAHYDLVAGRCYTFVSVGAQSMESLYAYLWDPAGRRMATEKDHRETAFTHCAQMSGRYRYLVKAADGDGDFRAAVFAR